MNKSVLILTTHILNASILSEYKKMADTPNVDAVMMIDNHKKEFEHKERIETQTHFGVEAKCFFFDEEVHEELKLPYYPTTKEGDFGKIMWWNADYRFYYFRHYFPEYDYYWLIEYDVFFNTTDGTYSAFVEKYDKDTADFVGPPLATKKIDDEWNFAKNIGWIYEDHVYGTIFPAIRLSRKAIDFLYERRLAHVAPYEAAEEKKSWVFVEAFVPTELKLHGFTLSSTKEPHVKFKPAISLNDQRIFQKPDNLLYHPVKPVNPDLWGELKKFGEFKKEFVQEQKELVAHFEENCMTAFTAAVHGSTWFTRQALSLGEKNSREVSWKYLLVLYRLLDEYRPKKILELNLGQSTKVTAQYATKFQASHTLLEHDRERVEHYLRCWDIPWGNTVIQGSNLLLINHADHADMTGVVYERMEALTKDQKYNLFLLKCPVFKRGLHIHMDLLTRMPDILEEDFAILMDHTEEAFGNIILEDMESILKKNEIPFLRKDFSEPGRKCSLLASENWKYIMEF